ncbi:MAG TPA: acyl-CoA dehydrogenase family protein, partial [Arenicellales bacterium]|nr:acyl-CoA dehydrogenase family protein [Arenicellales bacterium]
MNTHTVTNQTPPRVAINEFTTNVPLVEGVRRYNAEWALDDLRATGELVGRIDFQQDARRANEFPPVLRTHDAHGYRIDEVEYHPAYHRIMADAIAAGAHTSAWENPRPGANVARAAQFMLFAQVEPGHACPISMTHAVVPSLAFSPELTAEWLPRLVSREYDPELRAGKPGAIFGMAMTEKQGGSDVRSNATEAVEAKDGTWRLRGHKWFCSAPMSDAFLTLAQAPGGLSCFLVPRMLGDERNVFQIQRLKDKLGNRSNASGEIEFDGTAGVLVGEEGRGIRTIIEMVARTRLDNVFGAAAGMRQAVAE